MADGVIGRAATHCIHPQRLPFPLCFPPVGLLGPAWMRGGVAGAGASKFPGAKPMIFRDPGPLATKIPEEPVFWSGLECCRNVRRLDRGGRLERDRHDQRRRDDGRQ